MITLWQQIARQPNQRLSSPYQLAYNFVSLLGPQAIKRGAAHQRRPATLEPF
jgi:hypothetical protein